MEEKEITIENMQDVRDLFSLEVVLNGLMDKFQDVSKTVGEHDTTILELIKAVNTLNETLGELSKRVETLCDKTDIVDANSKLRKDNIALTKKVKDLTQGKPVEVKKKEEAKPAEISPVEEKAAKEEKPLPTDASKAVSLKVKDEARKIIASFKNTKTRLYRFNSMRGNYGKDETFARAIYDYLIEISFIDETGRILNKNVKI